MDILKVSEETEIGFQGFFFSSLIRKIIKISYRNILTIMSKIRTAY